MVVYPLKNVVFLPSTTFLSALCILIRIRLPLLGIFIDFVLSSLIGHSSKHILYHIIKYSLKCIPVCRRLVNTDIFEYTNDYISPRCAVSSYART